MAENIRITAATLRGSPDLMTAKDLASVLHIGRSKTYALLKNGTIRSMRIGAEYRVPKAFLLEYLNTNT